MPYKPPKGRGTGRCESSRYSEYQRTSFTDDWVSSDQSPSPHTEVTFEKPITIISKNTSPDVPFEQSINPYRGCEHGCIYCYARPSHAFLDLSPGLDFETKLTVKENAAQVLRKQLQAKNYRCKPINIGANTDPYQPIERHHQITRQLLAVFRDLGHPCTITTKSSLIERDIDLLAELTERNLVQVNLSFTTLDSELSRKLEPRATMPGRRLKTIELLRAANIPVSILLAPVIPVLTDHEIETILNEVAAAGANHADFILLRLPLELVSLFKDWLEAHYPSKANHVLAQIQETRQGNYNDSRFQYRTRGQGPIAELIAQRFALASKRLHLTEPLTQLSERYFHPHPQQLDLDLL